LVFNGIVLSIVADRLAQPENDWKPFEPKGLLRRVLSITTCGRRSGQSSAAIAS